MRLRLQCNGTHEQTTGILFTDLANSFRERGVDVLLEMRAFPPGVTKKIGYLWKRLFSCWSAMRQVDGLIVHTALSLNLPEMAFARLQRKPVVAFVWDIYPASTKAMGNIRNPILLTFYSLTERLGYALATKILIPSDDYSGWIAGRRTKVSVFPLWPRGRILGCRSELGDAEIAVVFAGQINAIRGLDTAVERFCERFPGGRVRLDIYSKSSTPPAVLGLAEKLGGNLAVRHLGFVPSEILSGRIADYDFGLVSLDPEFHLPSFPSKIIAYLSSGVPIAYFGPDYPGLRKLMQEFHLGLDLSISESSVSDVSDFEIKKFPEGRDGFFRTARWAQDNLYNYLIEEGGRVSPKKWQFRGYSSPVRTRQRRLICRGGGPIFDG